jgi:two-component system response regulator FixJ
MIEDASVYIVDDDNAVRDSLALLFKTVRMNARTFISPHEFLACSDLAHPGCILLDLRMPELNGLEVLTRLHERSEMMPVLIVTGYGNAPTAVRAVKLGAKEFLEKPVNEEFLIERVQHWVDADARSRQELAHHASLTAHLNSLSQRERQVLDCILTGMSNKEAARQLAISPKAIEIYRAHLMKKMEARTVVDLVLEVAGCIKCRGAPVIDPPCLAPSKRGRFEHWA